MAVQSLELAARSDGGSASFDDDGRPARTGTEWSCFAHIITAVIGSGVLSLAWSTAQLGWIAGPVCLLCFAIVTYVSAFLLSDCYRSPHPVTGTRNYSYMDAVRVNLGELRTKICGWLQYLSLYGTAVAYVITTATCMRAIERSNCYHERGRDAPCGEGNYIYMIVFGAVQIVVSQIPDIHDMTWLSVVAAVMSFSYSFIGLGLGFSKVIGIYDKFSSWIDLTELSTQGFLYGCVLADNGTIKGGIGGVETGSSSDKFFLGLQGVSDIAFAYPYSLIQLEIQDTLRSSPPENKTMKKASRNAIFVTTFFYMCCGCFGYAAFGSETPGNLLTGFGFYEPFWLVDFANACVVVHLIGGYQVYSQPVFAFFERWMSKKYPENGFVNKFHTFKLPLLPPFKISLFRICFRTAYVVSSTVLAMVFPYYNAVLGVLGALFWPLSIYFPVEMYLVQKKIIPWTQKWIVLRVFSLICFIVTVLGLAGSIQGIISQRIS